MFDLNSLTSAIITKIGSTGSLSALVGKTAFGFIAEGVTRPKCRLSVVGDDLDGSYGNILISTVKLQFSVFADTLDVASSLQAAICTAFHGVSLSLGGSKVCIGRLVPGRTVIIDSSKPQVVVYHSVTKLEFIAQN